MRPDERYFGDFDDVEDFPYARSRALQQLLESHRREERQQTNHRSSHKNRRQRDPWEWDDDDDFDYDYDDDAYVDDNYGNNYEDRNDSY